MYLSHVESLRSLAAHPRELSHALDAAGTDYTSETYPGTIIHGFTMSDTDAFSPSGLQRHWDRLIPLLNDTLASS